MGPERRRWQSGPPASPDSGLLLGGQPGVKESEEGSKERRLSQPLRPPSAGWPTPRHDHRLRLPHPRLSPAFSSRLRVRAMGHSVAVPRRSRHASIAGRVLCSVVARPRAVCVAEVPRLTGMDDAAAAGAAHLPAGDEGSESLPQGSMCATVAACRRASATAGALDLLPVTPSARPAYRDDLPMPTYTGG